MFHRQVVVAGSFHDDNGVLNVMLLLDLANLLHGQREEGGLVRERLTFEEHPLLSPRQIQVDILPKERLILIKASYQGMA